MPLGLTGGGESGGFFKYDAKDGVMKLDGEELPKNASWVMDFENAETGWMAFAPFSDFSHLVKVGNPWGPNPQPGTKEERSPYRIGFKIMCYSEKHLGGVKELMSNTKKTKDGMELLSVEYDEGIGSNAGKLPVVQLKSTIEIKETGGGKNYQPVFGIVKWVDRPAEMNGGAAPAPAAAAESDEPEF